MMSEVRYTINSDCYILGVVLAVLYVVAADDLYLSQVVFVLILYKIDLLQQFPLMMFQLSDHIDSGSPKNPEILPFLCQNG